MICYVSHMILKMKKALVIISANQRVLSNLHSTSSPPPQIPVYQLLLLEYGSTIHAAQAIA